MNARTELLGVIPNLDNEAYHSGPGVSNSVISTMAKSPAHCYALHLAPDRPKRIPTAAMLAGTLAHCAVLEPSEVAGRYVVLPAGAPKRPTQAQWDAKKPSPDSQAAMDWWTNFNASAAGAEIISAEQWATAQAQRAAVMAVPELAGLFKSGAAEQSAFWRDASTGLLCKCRPDWVHPLPDGRVILVDLKTTTDASPDAFSKTVWNYGYHRQAAWYSQGWATASGQEVAGFVFAAVCGEYPAIAAAYMLDDEAMAQGAEESAELLELYAECLRTGVWPGYGDSVQLISLPAWARRNMETEIGYV